MSGDLLQTKLYVPRLRPLLIPRPPPIKKLNQGLQQGCKPTPISAPAGFGKTTLATDWLSQVERPFAWLSLDEDDNDLTRFFTYAAAALQQIEGVGNSVQGLLQSPQPAPLKSLATAFINDCTAVSTPFILTLDDYHVITETAVNEAVAFLLSNLPPHLHLVIASRTDPLLPLPRLRARGQMTELRTDNLRFTAQEAASFLRQVMGLNLSIEEVSALETRTEGWIAGLQMVGLSMQGLKADDEIADFVADFTGSHRYIFDYLTDEVLRKRPSGTIEFLLQTSILDRLSEPLCDAVTGRNNSQALLEELDEANLFIVPLDNNRHWYRYHHLFADLLRHRLRQTSPDLEKTLHHRASKWYETQENIEIAIQYALAGGGHTRAALLLDQIALDFINTAEIGKLINLIKRIPEAVRSEYPRLCLAHAWALAFMRQLDQIEPVLKKVEIYLDKTQSLPSDFSADYLLAMATTIRAYQARWQHRLSEAVTLSNKAIKSFSRLENPAEQNLIGVVTLNLGITHKLLGNISDSEKASVKAITQNKEANRTFALSASIYQLMTLRIIQGKLLATHALGKNGLTWIEQAAKIEGRDFPAESEILEGLIKIKYEWNQLPAAQTHLEQKIKLQVLSTLEGEISLNQHLFNLHQAHTEFDKADEYHQKIMKLLEEREAPVVYSFQAQSVRRALLLNRVHPSTEISMQIDNWANITNIKLEEPIAYENEYAYATMAGVLITLGKPKDALPMIKQLSQLAERAGRYGDLIGYHILHALALQAQGESDKALLPLQDALVLAEPEGYIRTFVDEGEPLAALLRQIKGKDDKIVAYIQKLLTLFNVDKPHQPTPSPQLLQDALSEREMDVLRLLVTHLSGPEIAERLFISTNTFKTHTKNIYSKLNVKSRGTAVSRAQDLGLLS